MENCLRNHFFTSRFSALTIMEINYWSLVGIFIYIENFKSSSFPHYIFFQLTFKISYSPYYHHLTIYPFLSESPVLFHFRAQAETTACSSHRPRSKSPARLDRPK